MSLPNAATTAALAADQQANNLPAWQNVLLMVLIFVYLPGIMYISFIRGMRKRRRIARTTPMDEQILRLESIFTGPIEVEINRGETRLTKEQMDRLARLHSYTYSRTYLSSKYGPRKAVFRRLNEHGI